LAGFFGCLVRKDTLAKKTVKRAAAPKKATGRPATAKKTSKKMTARQFAVLAAKLAAENRCTDLTVLDLQGLSNTTDFFVIATGTSNRQMRTVADEISKVAKAAGNQRFGMAGYEQARWIVLDFIDVVVHVFDQEYRDYYDLEMLWGDAKRVKVPAVKLTQER
jgi:ribosome-associated protein